ncbi:unnamed protein product [Darwinula stevensoni]|uniref:Unc-50-like protein n=1 Tax=Darwinula stevensoni TaxID=69355 RepID=A0A7R9ADH0_9CRUS|nr:unnamed protein product [Darwinula stevensoni]CAG0901315.1 unnamed protein product [Darwinula stevensoni]
MAASHKYKTSPPPPRVLSPTSAQSSQSGFILPSPVSFQKNCMSAAAKRYKYLRRLIKFRQMDFEFAMWQMIYLFTSPQKVFRDFQYRKQTKWQYARDDPAFLVLLLAWMLGSAIIFSSFLHYGFLQFFNFVLSLIFLDCVGLGLLISTVMWFITNRFLRKPIFQDQDVEWGYSFDIHLNAFFPPLVILHIFQLIFYYLFYDLSDMTKSWFFGLFVGNTLWLISIGYYIYITFLGYSSLPLLQNTSVMSEAKSQEEERYGSSPPSSLQGYESQNVDLQSCGLASPIFGPFQSSRNPSGDNMLPSSQGDRSSDLEEGNQAEKIASSGEERCQGQQQVPQKLLESS